jgi:hypothetical protein
MGVPLEKKTIRNAKKLQEFPSILAQGLSHTIKYSRSICNPGEKIVLKIN